MRENEACNSTCWAMFVRIVFHERPLLISEKTHESVITVV